MTSLPNHELLLDNPRSPAHLDCDNCDEPGDVFRAALSYLISFNSTCDSCLARCSTQSQSATARPDTYFDTAIMAAGRSLKALVGRRRRLDEEGEDEEGSVTVDDSQSEGSVLTDVEEGDDEEEAGSVIDGQAVSGANVSTVDGASEGTANGKPAAKKSRKPRNRAGKKEAGEQTDGPADQANLFQATADTEVMMKGIKLADAGEGAIQFGEMDEPVHIPSGAQGGTNGNGRGERPADRQKREQQDNKPKRTADPAFIPNRGNFFMHDTRGAANGQGPLPNRGLAARGRGRGAPLGTVPSAPPNPAQRPEKASEMPWKHDLHEVINEESQAAAQNKLAQQQQYREDSARIFARPVLPAHPPRQAPPATLSFDCTIPMAKGQARVLLPGMKSAVMGSELSIKKYIRLPNHRPPLRRDKPVRVFIPNLGPRYIFPSMDRSFIFIPRQMRPNQRGFGNSNYQRNTGGHGYSSRRTSMYGGSMYSASIAPSRRSSIARDTFSPVSFASGFGGQSRPVVRLPHNGQFLSNTTSPAGPLSGVQTPTGQVLHTYPLPQQNVPTYNTPMSTVHQPRPQKQFSVTGIESPAALHQAQTPAIDEQQPFQNQLPTHMGEQQAYSQHPQAQFYPQQSHYGYPNQINQAGTPLSGIPENAMNAQAFQQQAMYYQQYPGQQNMYYQPHMQMYMPQTQGYMAPQQQAPAQSHHEPAQRTESQQQPPQQQEDSAPSGMVAHESNGMVFYLPASEAQQQPTQEQYEPAESFVPSYAMPGLPPPTPAPDASYYYPVDMNQAMYYPQQTQH